MDELLAEFVAEARELLESLSGQMVAWEADPADRELLDSIFRFFHTVKGNCGFFDLPRIERLAHVAEDALADVRAGRRKPDSDLVDAILAIIDRLATFTDLLEAGEEIPDGDDAALIAALDGGEDGEIIDGNTPDDPATATGGSIAKAPRPGIQRSIRLPVELLDRVMSGVSDMVVARNELARRLSDVEQDPVVTAPFNRLSSILDEVRDAMTRTRMQRIEMLFTTYPRVVRDLSTELGKQVFIELESGDVELDREMIELIRDPMMHMIRNAIDHGIETPEERRKAGKRENGLLSLSARQTGNEIRIGIVDDGRGIDSDKLVKRAVAANILTEEEVARLTPRERNALICEAGISTRDEASNVSGRGVGMDVVRANIERAGGSLMIDSTPGSGTRIMLNVPLTLSIVPSLTFKVGDQIFALPRSYVDEIVRIEVGNEKRADLGGKCFITLRENRIPTVPVSGILDIDGDAAAENEVFLIISLVGGDIFGLSVDEILNHEELVVKPIAPAIMGTGFFVGTTQLDDGRPVLMLDVSGVAREAGMISEVQNRAYVARTDTDTVKEVRREQVMLFTALDGRRMAVPMSTVTRVEHVARDRVHQAGDQSRVVIDEQILPLAGVPEGCELAEKVHLFRLSDGNGEIALAYADMIDLASMSEEDARSHKDGDAGSLALIDGEPTELVDCHRLFAIHGSDAATSHAPICRLLSNDGWSQDFLRPLVESAGYRVIAEGDPEEADISIAPSEREGEAGLKGANAILLRASKDARGKKDKSIYRYDRDGLLAALKAAQGGK